MTIFLNKLPRQAMCSAALLLICSSYAQAADNLDVTFSANIRETTCDIKIDGGTGDGTSNTITLGTDGKARVDDIANGAVKFPFRLVITECPSSLTALKTVVSGTASDVKTALANSVTVPEGGAGNVALAISRADAPEAPFEINATDDSKRLVWTSSEINSKEVDLLATLIETKTDGAMTGQFSTLATFNFTYE
ncbi:MULTISPECIES: fimbrial protein [Leclercia]|uniref:fimbrial protein n=1 Tax=Leclercia TaxID=83654 RepID=UPI001E4FE011|nr:MULTISPECIES: fimbrial protein [Leclercia]MDU4840229.1 fimbrial protein [Leclercia adecarboxylata]